MPSPSGCAARAVGAANVIYLSGQVGVGGGIVVDGRLLMGAQGYGGEVGHMRVNPKGRACRCGATGCWETEIGEPAVRLSAGASATTSVTDIVAAAAAGDKAAKKGLRTVGSLARRRRGQPGQHLQPRRRRLRRHAARDPARDARTRWRPSSQARSPRPGSTSCWPCPPSGDDSTLLGAAESAFVPLLDDPLGAIAAVSSTGLTSARASGPAYAVPQRPR